VVCGEGFRAQAVELRQYNRGLALIERQPLIEFVE